MGTSGLIEKLGRHWKNIFILALVAFILVGFATKLLLSAGMSLNSDMVGEGLQAMEIGKHGNYLLGDYYLPSEDTFIFTELLPFQLIPQVLTGYDPLTLKLVSFVIFALAVAALSYVVYIISGDLACALLFAALAANLPPEGYSIFAIPTSHMATIVFIGAILIILRLLGSKGMAPDRTKKGKKKQAEPFNVQLAYLAGLLVLVALAVLSDTAVLTWLIVPYIVAYVLFIKHKSPALNVAVACMAIVSVALYIFKTYLVSTWARQAMVTRDPGGIVSINLPLLVKSLAYLTNDGLYRLAGGPGGFGLFEALSLVLFMVLAAYAVKSAVDDKNNRPFYGMLLISGIVMAATFLMTTRVKDLSQARYFTFTALTVFMLIALAYRDGKKVFGLLAVALLLLSAAYGVTYALSHAQSPNEREQGLITFLKEHDLSFGYSTYWSSNVITYLSGEDVAVRAVHFYPDGSIESQTLLSCLRWYPGTTPDRAFLLIDNGAIDTIDANEREYIKTVTGSINSSNVLHYGDYDIYLLKGPAV